jgi:hypothetical protein
MIFPAILFGILATTMVGTCSNDVTEDPYITVRVDQADVLKGVTGFFVVASDLDSDGKKLGLTGEKLVSATEQILRRYNIFVCGKEHYGKSLGQAALLIRLTVLNDAAFLSVECRENVAVPRQTPTVVSGAVTYSIGKLITLSDSSNLIKSLETSIEKISNDYDKVNKVRPPLLRDVTP